MRPGAFRLTGPPLFRLGEATTFAGVGNTQVARRGVIVATAAGLVESLLDSLFEVVDGSGPPLDRLTTCLQLPLQALQPTLASDLEPDPLIERLAPSDPSSIANH